MTQTKYLPPKSNYLSDEYQEPTPELNLLGVLPPKLEDPINYTPVDKVDAPPMRFIPPPPKEGLYKDIYKDPLLGYQTPQPSTEVAPQQDRVNSFLNNLAEENQKTPIEKRTGRYNLKTQELPDLIIKNNLGDTEFGQYILNAAQSPNSDKILNSLLLNPDFESNLAELKYNTMENTLRTYTSNLGMVLDPEIKEAFIKESWEKGIDATIDKYSKAQTREMLESKTVLSPTTLDSIGKRITSITPLDEERIKQLFPKNEQKIIKQNEEYKNTVLKGADLGHIMRNEGGVYLTGYVPARGSGVTISDGVDLGQRTLSEFDNLKGTRVYEKLAQHPALFAPRAGQKGLLGDAAKIYLEQNPLELTEADALLLSSVTKDQLFRNSVRSIGESNFKKLPPNIKTVVLDLTYHRGSLSPEMRDALRSQNYQKFADLVATDERTLRVAPNRVRRNVELITP